MLYCVNRSLYDKYQRLHKKKREKRGRQLWQKNPPAQADNSLPYDSGNRSDRGGRSGSCRPNEKPGIQLVSDGFFGSAGEYYGCGNCGAGR